MSAQNACIEGNLYVSLDLMLVVRCRERAVSMRAAAQKEVGTIVLDSSRSAAKKEVSRKVSDLPQIPARLCELYPSGGRDLGVTPVELLAMGYQQGQTCLPINCG